MDLRIYWLSWISKDEFSGWELHWPWWTSGYGDGSKTICAAIYAPNEEAVREVVYDCYDARPDRIEFRFIEERPDGFSYTDRFPWRAWMPRFDESFDPEALTKTQAEASAAAKKAYASVVAIRAQDEAVRALPNRVVLLDEAVALVDGAVAGASVPETVEAMKAGLPALKGYRTMDERPLDDFDHGLFVICDQTDRKVYLKTESLDYYDLEGNAVGGFPSDTRIMPVSFSF
jgi:hypothetical protein